MPVEFTRLSPSIDLKPDVGKVRYPVRAVISDLPLLTSTTASVDAPSPGPTSSLIELLLVPDDDSEEVDSELSVQYASKNEGLLSVSESSVVGAGCAKTALFSKTARPWKYSVNKSSNIPNTN